MRVDRDPPRDPRAVGRVRRGRHDSAAVQSRGDLDRLRAARRHERQADHAAVPAGDAGRAAPNSVTFEKPSRDARAADRTVVAVLRRAALAGACLHEMLCCLPLVEVPAALGYDKVFRVTIVQFLDRFNFCLAGVKRSCIHFVTPERQDHPVRHLQSVLPQRPAGSPARRLCLIFRSPSWPAAGGADHGARVAARLRPDHHDPRHPFDLRLRPLHGGHDHRRSHQRRGRPAADST